MSIRTRGAPRGHERPRVHEGRFPAPALVREPRRTQPVYRIILALDIEGSTLRANPVKEELRDAVYELFGRAREAAGIPERLLDRLTDRGDGLLALIRPSDEIPKTRLLDVFVPALSELLAAHNTALAADDPRRLRLRVVIHAGEVHDDGKGFFGESLDVAFRLLDAAAVKRELKSSAGSLVLVVSALIYSTVVAHGYVPTGADDYRIEVRVRVRGVVRRGRIHLPGPFSAPGAGRLSAGVQETGGIPR